LARGPEGVHREVLVLEESGEIIGVVMHEDDDGDRFINALAIRSDQQARGFGELVLGTVLDDLAQRYAGHVATWLVAPANFASHAMSEAVGADVTYPAETKPNALYAIAL
jgi:ribosomal protein S18 acetylase RimI-like enzyme